MFNSVLFLKMSWREKLCLSFNNFDANIREYFRLLREDQKLFDATLVTDDGQHIKAHKIILSAGSNFFSDIFTKHNNSDVLIYLKGISSVQLQPVIDFIYNGEVFIEEEAIKEFIDSGQELQVRGIDGELTGISNNRPEEEEIHKIENKEHDNSVLNLGPQATDLEPTLEVNVNTYDELDLQIKQMMEKDENLWKCTKCGKTSRQKQVIRQHAETHIEGMSHACHLCTKTFTNRNTMKVHISNNHTGVFTCDICEKFGMTRSAFNQHKLKYCKTSRVRTGK